MSYFKHKQILYVNSNNRITGTHTDFQIRLDVDRNVKWDSVVVLDCCIPKSFYTISTNYNTFTLTENNNDYIVTLTAGNYTRKSLASSLVTALNATGAYTYGCTYQSINNTVDIGKYTFTCSGNSGVQPIFTMPLGGRIAEVLGFETGSSNSFVADSLQSTNVNNLNPETTIFIKSDICSNFNNMNLQHVIGTSDPSYSTISFKNHAPLEYSCRANIGSDNVFIFRITDENDNVVLDTNGLNVVINIMLFVSE